MRINMQFITASAVALSLYFSPASIAKESTWQVTCTDRSAATLDTTPYTHDQRHKNVGHIETDYEFALIMPELTLIMPEIAEYKVKLERRSGNNFHRHMEIDDWQLNRKGRVYFTIDQTGQATDTDAWLIEKSKGKCPDLKDLAAGDHVHLSAEVGVSTKPSGSGNYDSFVTHYVFIFPVLVIRDGDNPGDANKTERHLVVRFLEDASDQHGGVAHAKGTD